jgi:hypothetical protein
MPRYSTFALRTVIFFFVFLARLIGFAQLNAVPLHTGDLLPQLSGQTLANKPLELPSAASGKPAVLVFGFSRTGGKDARLWNTHLAKDYSNADPGYDVIVLESAPKLFRGMIVSGIRSGMPISAQERSIVLYQDEKLWKARLAVSDGNRAYVILLGPDSRIRWSNAGAFTDSEYARLKGELESLLKLHPEQ